MLATDYSYALQSVSHRHTRHITQTQPFPGSALSVAQCRTDSQMALTGWVSPRWG